jgi:hypothetical protein
MQVVGLMAFRLTDEWTDILWWEVWEGGFAPTATRVSQEVVRMS